jgi:hypothetical protein
MLLLAESAEKQKQWIQHISKKISKKGIVSSAKLKSVPTFLLVILHNYSS